MTCLKYDHICHISQKNIRGQFFFPETQNKFMQNKTKADNVLYLNRLFEHFEGLDMNRLSSINL